LYSLFLQATGSHVDPKTKKLVGGGPVWNAAKFTAALHNSPWYRNHEDNWRAAEILRLSDPKTWTRRISDRVVSMREQATQMGASLTNAQLTTIASTVLHSGMSDKAITTTLAHYIVATNPNVVQDPGAPGSVPTGRVLAGDAAKFQQQLTQLAADNGLRHTQDYYTKAAQAVVGGTSTWDDYAQSIRQEAALKYPSFADRLVKDGQSVKDLASSYTKAMDGLLEQADGTTTIFTPEINKALTSLDPKTQQPTQKPLWQFENEVRQDPRWLKTNNARESMNGVASKVLKDFGFAS
jgi:hypothetical protein